MAKKHRKNLIRLLNLVQAFNFASHHMARVPVLVGEANRLQAEGVKLAAKIGFHNLPKHERDWFNDAVGRDLRKL